MAHRNLTSLSLGSTSLSGTDLQFTNGPEDTEVMMKIALDHDAMRSKVRTTGTESIEPIYLQEPGEKFLSDVPPVLIQQIGGVGLFRFEKANYVLTEVRSRVNRQFYLHNLLPLLLGITAASKPPTGEIINPEWATRQPITT